MCVHNRKVELFVHDFQKSCVRDVYGLLVVKEYETRVIEYGKSKESGLCCPDLGTGSGFKKTLLKKTSI